MEKRTFPLEENPFASVKEKSEKEMYIWLLISEYSEQIRTVTCISVRSLDR